MKFGSCIRISLLFMLGAAPGSEAAEVQQTSGMADQYVAVPANYDYTQPLEFPAAFFQRYQPNTALDMVQQVPGFQLDDGDDIRGFVAAVGNILVNGRRIGAKRDISSAILSRIPAAHVERIDLIRGQVRGIDLRGQTEVVNIILREDVPAAVRWEIALRKIPDVDQLFLEGNVSLSDRWAEIEYNVGFNLKKNANGETGINDVLDGTGRHTEKRFEDLLETGYESGGNLTASTWLGETLLQLNAALNFTNEDEIGFSLRIPQVSGAALPAEIIIQDNINNIKYETGMSAEHSLTPILYGKTILLLINENSNGITSRSSVDASGARTQYREADTETSTTEMIGRLEFNWSGLLNHSVQFNVEGAYNELDGSLVQTVDIGTGPVLVDVPGANTRVEEVRGDFLLKDTWMLGRWELDYGLGAEVSRLAQSGDEEQERDFFYLKPHAVLSYSPSQGRQTRLRLAREVAQLDFNDFVSSVVYQDDNLALGNPNLRPDTTWVAEFSHERRFGELSVVKATLFHHWIADVLDLLPLPLTSTFEVPGNIGDGRRWGMEVEATIPLDRLGLPWAKLGMKARWQDSTVVDPVSGENRVFSGRRGFSGYSRTNHSAFRSNYKSGFIFDYRQDFDEARVAWGWYLRTRTARTLFKVNERDVYDDEFELDAFIETTRWLGLKMAVIGENLTNSMQLRDRTVFMGKRDLSFVEFRELAKGKDGMRITILLSGNF